MKKIISSLIIGGIIGNSLVNFHKALFKVQGQKKR